MFSHITFYSNSKLSELENILWLKMKSDQSSDRRIGQKCRTIGLKSLKSSTLMMILIDIAFHPKNNSSEPDKYKFTASNLVPFRISIYPMMLNSLSIPMPAIFFQKISNHNRRI